MAVLERHPERDGEYPDSTCFLLTKQVDDLALLDKELADAHGWERPQGLTAEGLVGEAGPDAPTPLWVHHTEVNVGLAQRVVEGHPSKAEENWS